MVFADRHKILNGTLISNTPGETFELGEMLGGSLAGGEAILLSGGLGAGKTLLAKGILNALEFDVDEVTSPSFTLVNLYETERFKIYHIDLWRLDEGTDIAFAVGLHEIFQDEKAVVIIEWAEKLGHFRFAAKVIQVKIEGDGEDSRTISIDGNDELDRPASFQKL